MTKKRKINTENKTSENIEKDVKLKGSIELDNKKESKILAKKEKYYTQVPSGIGGQFVDIGGGVKVPASEIDQNK